MQSDTGLLTIKCGPRFYSLFLAHNGWLAADLLQYIDEILESREPEIAVLKLLGYTMQISGERPAREAGHWVEVDLAGREVLTNSEMIRQAVDQESPREDQPYSPLAMKRLYQVLDKYDFTVRFRKK